MPSAATPLSRTARRRCPSPGPSHADHIASLITRRPFPFVPRAPSRGVYGPPRPLTPRTPFSPYPTNLLEEGFSELYPAREPSSKVRDPWRGLQPRVRIDAGTVYPGCGVRSGKRERRCRIEEAVLITGVYGSGKSSVAEEMVA